MANTVTVDEKGVHFREGLRNRCIPFEDIKKAFIRIHEVDGKLCCGSTVFQYFRLVLVNDKGKEFADVLSENEKELDNALEEIHKLAPDIEIGFNN